MYFIHPSFNFVSIFLKKQENLNPNFLINVNKDGTVPALVHGEKMIPDSRELSWYLEDTIKDSKSLVNKENRDEIKTWMDKIHKLNFFRVSFAAVEGSEESKFLIKMSENNVNKIKELMNKYPDLEDIYENKLMLWKNNKKMIVTKEEKSKAWEEFSLFFDELEKTLSKTKYLVGDEFTMADCHLIPVFYRMEELKNRNMKEADLISNRENVLKYWHLMKNRESFQIFEIYEMPIDSKNKN